MNQTWVNDKKPNFTPDFGPNLGPNNFFRGFYPYKMWDTVASNHCAQFQEKRTIQTQENGKKTHLGPD